MPTLTRATHRVAAVAAFVLLAATRVHAQSAPDSLADIRTSPATIRALLDAHLFSPRVLESPSTIATLRAVDSLAGAAQSRREFFSGFNRLWAAGPVSHVRVGRAPMPANAMMAFVDTMRAGDDAMSLRWEGRIAILDLRTMNGVDTRERISRAFETIVAQGAEGLIIDLRANEGGAFAVVPLVGHLIAKPVEGGVFLGRKWNAAHSRVPTATELGAITPWTGWSLTRFWGDVESAGILRLRFTPMAPHFAGPVMLLTSRTTASAAELATDALLNDSRVTVLGERSAGQMLSQRMFDLFPGTHLYVPIADYYSARMGRIEGVGITPTVAMPATVALDSALARLRSPRTRPAAAAAAAPAAPALTLHRAVATERGYDANAWWIESPDGLVLIDALMLRSDARALVAALKSTGKPLRAVLITHAHADHFGGLSTIRAAYPGVPIVATRPTADGMRVVHDEGMVPNGWLRALGADYDSSFVAPDRIVYSGDTVRFAGVTLIVRDYGAMESHNNSVIHVPELKAVFTGDATVHGASFYVGTIDAKRALTALPRILADHPGEVTAYAGHYGPRALDRTVADNLEQVRRLHATTALVGSDPNNRAPNGDLTLPAKRLVLLLAALQAGERADYGIGAVGFARFQLPATIAAFIADSARRTPPAAKAVRDAMRPLLFMAGRYDRGEITVGLGGLYLDATVESANGYRYQLMFSYDHVQRRYRVVSRDQISGLIDVFVGVREADGSLLVSNVEPGTHYLDASGVKVFNRMRFTPKAEGSWVWRVETGRGDGVWTDPFEQEMKRRALR
ncbi:MAG: MBL fold metallo-hydrolase [Gemmatimonadaceae bacterium]|nr:MBL fold metallo-hydrolase [Gemmatimonadaceae bacterium]